MANNIGIDLGTASVLINVSQKGIVLDEPAVVAVDSQSNRVLAVGSEAYKMVGKTPNHIRAIRPLKGGVIADFDMCEQMLTYFVKKLSVKGLMSRPTILVCCPTSTTQIERKAIHQAADKASGGGKVYLVEEARVAALGAGLDIFKPKGSMIIDIGGGTSDIAVLSLGDVVAAKSLRVAGDKMNEAIANSIKQKYNLQIGEQTAEMIKREIGSVKHPLPEKTMDLRGRNIKNGLPETITVSSADVHPAISTTLYQVVNAAKNVLAQTPPELASDIIERGIVLTGGGALIDGATQLFSSELQVPVFSSENPRQDVAVGTGIMLEEHADQLIDED